MSLNYSRIEFAADAVKSVRPKGKLCWHIIKRNTF